MCSSMPGTMLKFIGDDVLTTTIHIITAHTPTLDDVMGPNDEEHTQKAKLECGAR